MRIGQLGRRWWWAIAGVLILAVVATVLIVRLNPDSEPVAQPRPLTTAEADRLAVLRFRNYQAGTLGITMTLPAASGDVHLAGLMDYRQELGFVTMRTDNRTDADSAGLVQFTASGVAFLAGPVDALPPKPPQSSGWQLLPNRTDGSSPLNTLFNLALGLGADRPDNAQLLRQQGAQWLREDTLDGTAVTVFAGPTARADGSDDPEATAAASGSTPQQASRTRYWVDATGRLLRLEARIGTSTTFAVIDLRATEAADPIPLGGLPGVQAPPSSTG